MLNSCIISATVLRLVCPALELLHVSAPAVVLLGRPTIVRRSHVLPVSFFNHQMFNLLTRAQRSGAPANIDIIIIHLFAINKQSLTQSKEWQVTRET